MTSEANSITPESLSDSDSTVLAAARDAYTPALADLGDLVRIPGIAWPAFDQQNLQRSAAAVAALLSGTGAFDTVDIRTAAIPGTDEQGQPAVLATRAAKNGAPTILLYAHHDVQPPGDASLWETPPFEPTVRGGRLYGRGAADDKAGIMAHVASIRALMAATDGDFDLGISVFVEGEEEFGSRSFGQFLSDNQDALRADVIVVADSGNWDSETPAITVSLRGNVRFTLTVRTLDHASHSGMFGGPVPDAMLATIKLLATLWDDDGAVAVPGLLVRDTETPEYTEATLREESGLLEGVSTIGTGTILSRIWNKPSATVTGIDHTSVETASNTISPEVSVVISCRIAPGQDPDAAYAAIQQYLLDQTPFGAQLTFSDVDLGSPFLVDTSGDAVEVARASMRDAYGRTPVDMGMGGSIPFIADLVRDFPDAQILVTGVEDPNSRAHSPNESLHLDTFANAIAAEALLLNRLNDRPRA